MNGPAQIEAPSAAAHTFAPDQPRAHHARKPRGQRMRLRDVGRIDDVAQIGGGQILETRGAFAFTAAIAGAVTAVVPPLDVIGKTRRSRSWAYILEIPCRGTTLQRGTRKSSRLTNTATQPVRVENFVEALPIGVCCAKQRAQGRLQRGRPRRQRCSEYLERISCFGQANLETVIAQRACKTSQPPTHRRTDTVTGSADRRN